MNRSIVHQHPQMSLSAENLKLKDDINIPSIAAFTFIFKNQALVYLILQLEGSVEAVWVI